MKYPITVWRTWSKKSKKWVHNHIEDEHCENGIPTPMSNKQKKMWSGKRWQKVFAYLDSNTNQIVDTE